MTAIYSGMRRLALGAALVCAGLVGVMTPLRATGNGFEPWLAGVRQEAAQIGISEATIAGALGDVAPIPRVIELDRRQPESTMRFEDYLTRVVNEARIREGKARLRTHRQLLDRVGRRFGVQPRFIVALWGIETNYGAITGGFPVVGALVTLAYDGRRSSYFRKELFNALKILDAGHITVAEMQGSWAGAMGQSQFMPSSFLALAIDYDGDGRRDIWTTEADVFASIANYLARYGWRRDITWGRKVRLPPGFDSGHVTLDRDRRLGEWQTLGVRRLDGRDLPRRDIAAALIRPDGDGDGDGPVYLVYKNFRALMKWNRSKFFGIAVGHLSDRIAAR